MPSFRRCALLSLTLSLASAAEGGRLVFDEPVAVTPEPREESVWLPSEQWGGAALRLSFSSLPLHVTDAGRDWYRFEDQVSSKSSNLSDADRAWRATLGFAYRSPIGYSPWFGWTGGLGAAYSRIDWDDAGDLPTNPLRSPRSLEDWVLANADRLELLLQNTGGVGDLGFTMQPASFLRIDLTGNLGFHYAWGEVQGTVQRSGGPGQLPVMLSASGNVNSGYAYDVGGKLGVYALLGAIEVGVQGGWMLLVQESSVYYDRQSLVTDDYESWYAAARRTDRIELQGFWGGASLGWLF